MKKSDPQYAPGLKGLSKGRSAMKNLVILGAGTAGTIIANAMVRDLPDNWAVQIVDPNDTHLYQPGLLFLPFGARDEDQMLRPRGKTLSEKVQWVHSAVDRLDYEQQVVLLQDGQQLPYDLLVIATGSQVRPEMTEGLMGPHWYETAFDFYTLEGAQKLREKLATFAGGRLVLNVVEMPIKCPVAPLEFLFLADAFFKDKGIRKEVELVYVTPLDAAFTKPLAAERIGYLLEEKGIQVVTEFNTGEVDGAQRKLISWDERTVDYDLLVSVPTHTGADFVERSEIGDELAFIPTDPHTLAAKEMANVFVLGDATDLPSSKAGSVAHFQAEGVVRNLMRLVKGNELKPEFDGHANCFVETGHDKAMLIDFNYEVEPLPGKYPVPGIGPFSLLKESRLNHVGKLVFRPLYWHGLLPARPLPVSARMSMAGKEQKQNQASA